MICVRDGKRWISVISRCKADRPWARARPRPPAFWSLSRMDRCLFLFCSPCCAPPWDVLPVTSDSSQTSPLTLLQLAYTGCLLWTIPCSALPGLPRGVLALSLSAYLLWQLGLLTTVPTVASKPTEEMGRTKRKERGGFLNRDFRPSMLSKGKDLCSFLWEAMHFLESFPGLLSVDGKWFTLNEGFLRKSSKQGSLWYLGLIIKKCKFGKKFILERKYPSTVKMA